MFVAEKMNRVSVLIMKEDIEPVVEEIAKSGVLHLTRIEELDAWAGDLKDISVETLSNEYSRRRRKLKELIAEIEPEGPEPGREPGGEIGLADLGQLDRRISAIEEEIAPLIKRKQALGQQLHQLKNLRGQIDSLVPADIPMKGLFKSAFLATAAGSITEANLDKLRSLLAEVPSVVLPYKQEGGRVHLVAVVLRKDKSLLEGALKQVGFSRTEAPGDIDRVSGEIGSEIVERMAAVEQDLADARSDLKQAARGLLPELGAMLSRVEAAILLLKIKQYCKITEKTCLFSGWVPRESTDALVRTLEHRTEGRAVVEVVAADKIAGSAGAPVEVPVLLKQPPFLRPFEMLVSGYGTPSYRMIDPTPFVGVTFLVMFGMMFGDIGHGLVLLGAGIIMALRSIKWREIGKLVAYCGGASMVFGALYGSFFGLEELLRPIWVKPLENVTDLFKFAIGFGIVVVSLGIILNIVNSLRAHSFLETFFDKSGPLVGVVYWAGIGLVIKYVMTEGGSPDPVLFYGLFMAPLAVFALRGPLLRLMRRRRRAFEDGVGTYIMETAVEILEILMGYLANTVSFIRVAAFGLAHAGLFIAVFSLADVVASRPGGTLLSWIVLVLGNVVIILLEGLVVSIQAMRLTYYEFFSKFFKGLGSKYQPAKIVGDYSHEAMKGGE
jgi:V/A-type H+-transporting ATPase subunit I